MKEALAELGKADITLTSKVKYHDIEHTYSDFKLNRYTLGENIATREAFGNALVALGKTNKNVIVLDADVKNSTMTEKFFKAYPNRSFESFIAEQNMVGMAIGFSAMGYAPFVATFAA